MNVHSSFICNNQNLETTQMLFIGWLVKQWYIHTVENQSAIKGMNDLHNSLVQFPKN